MASNQKPISKPDLARLQSRLRGLFGSAQLYLDPPATRNGPVQLRVGGEVLGTVDQVDEDGERSWAVTLIVLAEDLD